MGLIKKKSRDKLKNKKFKKESNKKKSKENFKSYNKLSSVKVIKNEKNNKYKIQINESKSLLNHLENENKNKYLHKQPQKKMPIKMLNGIRKKYKEKIRNQNEFNRESGILYDSSQNKKSEDIFLKKKKIKKFKKEFKSSNKNIKFKDGEIILSKNFLDN